CLPKINTAVPVVPLVGVNDLITGRDVSVININVPAESVPNGVVTCTPPVAPEPTTALIAVSDTTENPLAETPPKLTFVVPVKWLPLIITVAPAAAAVGVKEVM